MERANPSPSGSNRRNPFDVWAELMESCLRNGRTQSWLMRRLRLKTNVVREAIEYLVTTGLITEMVNENIDNRQYRTTQKGELALQSYYDLITKFFGRSRPQHKER